MGLGFLRVQGLGFTVLLFVCGSLNVEALLSRMGFKFTV